MELTLGNQSGLAARVPSIAMALLVTLVTCSGCDEAAEGPGQAADAQASYDAASGTDGAGDGPGPGDGPSDDAPALIVDAADLEVAPSLASDAGASDTA